MDTILLIRFHSSTIKLLMIGHFIHQPCRYRICFLILVRPSTFCGLVQPWFPISPPFSLFSISVSVCVACSLPYNASSDFTGKFRIGSWASLSWYPIGAKIDVRQYLIRNPGSSRWIEWWEWTAPRPLAISLLQCQRQLLDQFKVGELLDFRGPICI